MSCIHVHLFQILQLYLAVNTAPNQSSSPRQGINRGWRQLSHYLTTTGTSSDSVCRTTFPPAASTPACSPPRVPRRSSALLHLLVSTPPSLVAIAAAQGQGDFSVLAAFSAFWGAAFSVQTAVHGAVSLRRGRRSPPEAMRAGHVCSVLASLMLLWLGVAAAQEASSWKTLSGTRPPMVLFLFFQGRRAFGMPPVHVCSKRPTFVHIYFVF